MALPLRKSDRRVLLKCEHRIVRPLVFSNPPHDFGRVLPLFYHRDPLANLISFGALAERGRTLGDPIFSMPPVPPDLMKEDDWCYECELQLGTEHEVFCTTRPPLDDQEFGEPKQVVRGYTQIEEDVRDTARQFFKHLSRSQSVLQPHVAEALREGCERWSNVEFYQRMGARVQSFVSLPKKQRRAKGGPNFLTVGCIVRKPNFNATGATLLNVFGMDGSATLVWSYLVARYHTDWLFEDGFRMVAISGPRLPVRASDLSFLREYQVQELLHVAA